MGKAGQALRQVLESYNISQSLLAKKLGVERPIVFRWFHEQIDPTAQTVAEIVQALHQIDSSAANDFIQSYLGNLVQSSRSPSTHDLPLSDSVNISALSQIFNNTTNSYKYLFFLSLLDILRRGHFDNSSPVTFEEIIIEMLANAWYPHNYFKLSFGTQDQIANKLDSLDLVIGEPILQFRDTDKKLLRDSLKTQNLKDIVDFVGRYVPFRLIRPFFSQQTRGLIDAKVDRALIELSNTEFEQLKPIYKFNGTQYKDCTAIIIHQDWIEYLSENYSIVRGWVSWEWLQYMQRKNPSVPNVVNKIFMPQQRNSLTEQSKYWQIILETQEIECIYSKAKLDKNRISLDHYLPWSFVAHDQLWNLVPTFPEINSSKSNNLPSSQYFDDFVKLQHLGLNISYQALPTLKWNKYVESYINELKLNQTQDLLSFNHLRNAYEVTIKPLLSLAIMQGFTSDWSYRSSEKDNLVSR